MPEFRFALVVAAPAMSHDEILDATDQQPELKVKIEKFLNEKKAQTKDLSTLISWGFRLVEYHKKPEYQATLHPSPK